MRLIIPVLLNCMLVLGVYLADKHTTIKKLSYIKKQIIIGVLFGGVSAFASSFGVEWLGTVVNVRDAAPLSAGLIFGAPAGIIAGFIVGFPFIGGQVLIRDWRVALPLFLQALWRRASENGCLRIKNPIGFMAVVLPLLVKLSI